MKYKVTLNGKVYEVEVEKGEAMLIDEYEAKAPVPAAAPVAAPAAPAAAAPAAAPAPAAQATAAGEQIKSPLPGNVLQIKVSVGQAVKTGDVLAVIEAMKMENDVLATKDGSVKQILVNKGATVATGDVLMVI